jgi:protein phosphatase 4 regulatory subunit 3
LMKSTHTFLVLGALRFLRKIVALKDDFYNRYVGMWGSLNDTGFN